MKKFLFLMVTVVIITTLALSSVVMAADESMFKFKKTAIDYSGTAFQIDVVVAADEIVTPAAEIAVEYDASLWKISSITSGGGKTTSGGKNIVSITSGTMDPEDPATFGAGDVVLKFKAVVLDDSAYANANFGTSEFKFFYARTLNADAEDYEYIMADKGVVTVTDTRSFVQDTPATVSAPNMAWAEYTVGNTLYKGIWTGAYTVTAGTKKVDDITVAVNGAAAESLDVEAEAGATVDFKIAVIGKPALDATGIVVTAVEAQ